MIKFVYLTDNCVCENCSMCPYFPDAKKQCYVAASTGILHFWPTVSKKLMTERVNETEERTDGVTE